jgi:hypothetical protein
MQKAPEARFGSAADVVEALKKLAPLGKVGIRAASRAAAVVAAPAAAPASQAAPVPAATPAVATPAVVTPAVATPAVAKPAVATPAAKPTAPRPAAPVKTAPAPPAVPGTSAAPAGDGSVRRSAITALPSRQSLRGGPSTPAAKPAAPAASPSPAKAPVVAAKAADDSDAAPPPRWKEHFETAGIIVLTVAVCALAWYLTTFWF